MILLCMISGDFMEQIRLLIIQQQLIKLMVIKRIKLMKLMEHMILMEHMKLMVHIKVNRKLVS